MIYYERKDLFQFILYFSADLRDKMVRVNGRTLRLSKLNRERQSIFRKRHKNDDKFKKQKRTDNKVSLFI